MARKKRSRAPVEASEPSAEDMRRMDAERLVERNFRKSKTFGQRVVEVMRELAGVERGLDKKRKGK